jgi:Family of unknown function (DUF6467)
VGAEEATLVGVVEAAVKYHSPMVLSLMLTHELGSRQGQAGSLTGAVASQSVTEAPKGSLRVDGHHPSRVQRQKGA